MVDPFLSPPRAAGHSRPSTEARILRERIITCTDALDVLRGAASHHSARQLVQVYNGGAMPTVVPAVYFTHPVIATGFEAEGAVATLTADTATTIPVVVLNAVPSVGDYLTAYAVGGRWVSEETNPNVVHVLPCAPCNLPQTNLTISWTNPLTGNGSATMVYSASPDKWVTGCCDGGLFFELLCTGGGIELRVFFFTSGVCPTGTTSFCSNLQAAPLELVFSNHTCSPLSLVFEVNGAECPTLFSDGNTQFTVTL
jgi:hypothetical protein